MPEEIKAGCCIECGRKSRTLVCAECDQFVNPWRFNEPWTAGGDRRWNGVALVKVPLADHQAGLRDGNGG